jgi:hypothetical protein
MVSSHPRNLPGPSVLWFLTCCVPELEAYTKANEELHKLREAAEGREAATEDKLHLERQARQGTVRESYMC